MSILEFTKTPVNPKELSPSSLEIRSPWDLSRSKYFLHEEWKKGQMEVTVAS